MDSGLLHAIVSEVSLRLAEQELHRVSNLGAWRYLFRFATPEHDNLLISVRPEMPRAHLMPRGGGHHEAPPDRFTALADRELAGGRLIAIEATPGERVLRLSLRVARPGGPPVERHLVAELFGRSTNLVLLDAAGVVLGCARELRNAPRAPIEGEPYQPPPAREAVPDRPAGMVGTGAAVLSSRPLVDYREGDRPGRDEIRVVLGETTAAPTPAEASADRSAAQVTRFPGPSAAAAAAFGLIERLRDFDEGRTRHRVVVRRERSRIEVLATRLEEDLARARGADRHRRWAEALLAGLRAARVEGKMAVVADPESAEPVSLEVPIDPALGLLPNAERHFALWKKGKRGEATILARRDAVRRRLDAWVALETQAEAVASGSDLDALRQAMAVLGMVHAAPRPKRVSVPTRREEPTRVRRHTTADGYVVLVGRSGPENDTLTFRVASPWDIWLHAAGLPGAHVIIRNPARLKSVPEGTLRAAAGIAAWYSGARGDSKVEVHYTPRKHVHKRKGMPAGQVLVRRFRSILVAPRLPQPAIEEV